MHYDSPQFKKISKGVSMVPQTIKASCAHCDWRWIGPRNLFGDGKGVLEAALYRLHYEEQPGPVDAPPCERPKITMSA